MASERDKRAIEAELAAYGLSIGAHVRIADDGQYLAGRTGVIRFGVNGRGVGVSFGVDIDGEDRSAPVAAERLILL